MAERVRFELTEGACKETQMKRVSLVIAFALLVVACSRPPASPAHTESERQAPCRLVKSQVVADAALAYFHTRVGAPVVDARLAYVEECSDRWGVLIWASVEGHELPRLWHVQLRRPDMQAIALIGPE